MEGLSLDPWTRLKPDRAVGNHPAEARRVRRHPRIGCVRGEGGWLSSRSATRTVLRSESENFKRSQDTILIGRKRLRGTLPVTLKSATSAARHLLVMELVEGEDLGQRLVAGPLPLEESLSYAKQIAEALGLPKI